MRARRMVTDADREEISRGIVELAEGQVLAARIAPTPSPWERGTNENTNGLLREYFPEGTDITDDQVYLDLVTAELTNRPRRILGYRTPAEVFTDLLTSSIASTG